MPQHTTFYVLLETSRHFTRQLLRGVIRWSNLYGPVTLVAASGHVDQELPKLVDTENVGILSRLSTPGVLEARHRHGIPVITIEPSLPEHVALKEKWAISEILSNSPKIARMGAQYFLSRGFRHFAYCGLPRRLWSDIREKEFVREISFHEKECFVYPFPEPGRPLSREEEYPFLSRWLASLPKPVAILTCNDDRGSQIIEICNFEGYLVPDQVAVLGIDNDDLICELSHPALSSIALDLESAGFRAAQTLWNLVSGKATGYQCVGLEPSGIVTRFSSDVTAQDDTLIYRAICFMRNNYQSAIGPLDVAKGLNVSRRTLERRFAEILGRSVRDRIQQFRLEQAEELLIYTNDSVERIAEASGFGNLKQMLRAFMKSQGISPGNFRKRHTVRK